MQREDVARVTSNFERWPVVSCTNVRTRQWLLKVQQANVSEANVLYPNFKLPIIKFPEFLHQRDTISRIIVFYAESSGCYQVYNEYIEKFCETGVCFEIRKGVLLNSPMEMNDIRDFM